MRCFGVKVRWALRCKRTARPGMATCSTHEDQEDWAQTHFPEEITREGCR